MGIVFEVFGFESGNFGTPNPKVLFYGMVLAKYNKLQSNNFLAFDSIVLFILFFIFIF